MDRWFKLAARTPRDPKLKRCSVRARWGFIEVLCELAEAGSQDGIYYAARKTPVLTELVGNGLLTELGEGAYLVLRWVSWNGWNVPESVPDSGSVPDLLHSGSVPRKRDISSRSIS